MITQINPPLPVTTPKGPALAHFIIDDGIEHDLKWVCFQDNTGECWTWRNQVVRAHKNITQGRDYISPFYNPDDVAFHKDEEECNLATHFLHLKCYECETLDWVPCNEAKEWKCPVCPEKETAIQKQLKEAKRMSETMPNFEQFTKINTPIHQDDELHKKIREAASHL